MPRRYTDSSLTLLVRNLDLRSARKVYVTISQYQPVDCYPSDYGSGYTSGGPFGKQETTIQVSNITYTSPNTLLVVNLTQQNTAAFKSGYLRVQVNWIDSSGKRKATVIKKIRHRANLHEEVLS